MPGGNRKAADAQLVATLAGGASVQAAAQLCEVSESTIFRRLRNAEFKQRIDQARRELVDRALGHLAEGAAEAAIQLRKLVVKSRSPGVKLQAAKAVLSLGNQLRENLELEARISALEKAARRTQA